MVRQEPASEQSTVRDLDDELPELLELDAARRRAAALRDDGIRSLVPLGHGTVPARWEPSDQNDTAETLLIRRVKHVAWSTGLIQDSYKNPQIPEMPVIDLATLFEGTGDEMSVYLAANYLRAALDEPGTQLSPSMLLCYYRILRELYFFDSPDWMMGAARATSSPLGSGPVSVFVTAECARALSALANKMVATAEFLEGVASTISYAYREVHAERISRQRREGVEPKLLPLGLADSWCDVELDRVSLSLRITLGEARGKLLFDLPTPAPEATWQTSIDTLRTILHSFIIGSAASVREAIGGIDGWRREEEIRAATDKAQKRTYSLSHSAHERAYHAIDAIQGDLLPFIAETRDKGEYEDKDLRRLADGLRRGASGLRLLLEPTEKFVISYMHQALSGSTAHSLTDVPSAVFAVASAGALSGRWQDSAYRRAATVLGETINERGMFPGGQPVHLGSRGWQYNTLNADVIRGFAQVLQHVQDDVRAALVNRLVSFFESGAIRLADNMSGWGRGLASHRAFACKSVTASSVLALNRLVRMLDTEINRRVKRHFVVRTARDLENTPRIDGLMCTDIGLTAASRGTAKERILSTAYVELMRAHVLGQRVVDHTGYEDVYSAVFYGPPGTGKTTLIESLAKTCGTDLVYITPSDFLIAGMENVERRATAVMNALTVLTHTVILFDEFDSVLYSRENRPGPPGGPLDLLPGSMLPKFAALADAAKRNRTVYSLATNYIERIDEAAIRPGRFNHRISVLPPDVPSRICRLVREVRSWTNRVAKRASPVVMNAANIEKNIAETIRQTAGVPTVVLCKRGWFMAPRGIRIPPITPKREVLTSAWDFIFSSEDPGREPSWPIPDRRRDVLPISAPRRREDNRDNEERGNINPNMLEQQAELDCVDLWNTAMEEYFEKGEFNWQGWIKSVLKVDGAVRARIDELFADIATIRRSRLGLDGPGSVVDAAPAGRPRRTQRVGKQETAGRSPVRKRRRRAIPEKPGGD